MLATDAAERKAIPITTGFIDYFPDAMVEVAILSRIGNEQHNPGQPLHWAKEKSTDHANCIVRHLLERGTIDTDGVRHSAKVAWRAMALLQIEIENARAADTPNGIAIPVAGGMTLVKKRHGESMSEAICRTVCEVRGLPKIQEQKPYVSGATAPLTPPPLPQSKFGFTVGDRVNMKRCPVGQNPGKITGFDKGVSVLWDRNEIASHGYQPADLRHGE